MNKAFGVQSGHGALVTPLEALIRLTSLPKYSKTLLKHIHGSDTSE